MRVIIDNYTDAAIIGFWRMGADAYDISKAVGFSELMVLDVVYLRRLEKYGKN